MKGTTEGTTVLVVYLPEGAETLMYDAAEDEDVGADVWTVEIVE